MNIAKREADHYSLQIPPGKRSAQTHSMMMEDLFLWNHMKGTGSYNALFSVCIFPASGECDSQANETNDGLKNYNVCCSLHTHTDVMYV